MYYITPTINIPTKKKIELLKFKTVIFDNMLTQSQHWLATISLLITNICLSHTDLSLYGRLLYLFSHRNTGFCVCGFFYNLLLHLRTCVLDTERHSIL